MLVLLYICFGLATAAVATMVRHERRPPQLAVLAAVGVAGALLGALGGRWMVMVDTAEVGTRAFASLAGAVVFLAIYHVLTLERVAPR